MSPETVSQSVYLKESDIYSFGLLCYEVLTGLEFLKNSDFEYINKVVNEKFRPSLEQLNDFPDLKNLIKICWADDITVRPNFGQICEVLTKFINNFSSDC